MPALVLLRGLHHEPDYRERAVHRVAQVLKLWIFPTPDSNVVFVQYTIGSDVQPPTEVPDSEHLAIIEMRGERIFKMRNFRNLHGAQF